MIITMKVHGNKWKRKRKLCIIRIRFETDGHAARTVQFVGKYKSLFCQRVLTDIHTSSRLPAVPMFGNFPTYIRIEQSKKRSRGGVSSAIGCRRSWKKRCETAIGKRKKNHPAHTVTALRGRACGTKRGETTTVVEALRSRFITYMCYYYYVHVVANTRACARPTTVHRRDEGRRQLFRSEKTVRRRPRLGCSLQDVPPPLIRTMSAPNRLQQGQTKTAGGTILIIIILYDARARGLRQRVFTWWL